jgi:hypothetical protein
MFFDGEPGLELVGVNADRSADANSGQAPSVDETPHRLLADGKAAGRLADGQQRPLLDCRGHCSTLLFG